MYFLLGEMAANINARYFYESAVFGVPLGESRELGQCVQREDPYGEYLGGLKSTYVKLSTGCYNSSRMRIGLARF